jgi:hypothetical protein
MAATGGGFSRCQYGQAGIAKGSSHRQIVNANTVSMMKEQNFEGIVSGKVCGVRNTTIDVDQVLSDYRSG